MDDNLWFNTLYQYYVYWVQYVKALHTTKRWCNIQWRFNDNNKQQWTPNNNKKINKKKYEKRKL